MNKLIIIIGVFVLSLILGLTLLWPKYQNLQILQADIKEKKLDFQSKKDYFSKIKETSVQLGQYQEPLAKISSALPLDPALPPLISFFQSSAVQTGLLLEKISWVGTAASKEKGNLKETQVSFQLTGSYDNLKNFLLVLEGSARMIEVQNISVEAPKKELKESPTFVINIKTYSY